MPEVINTYLASDYWEYTTMLLGIWGVTALFMLLLGRADTSWKKVYVWVGLTLLSGSILFSMVFETYLPAARHMSTARALSMAFGLAGFFAATALFVYGGWRFVRDTSAGLQARDEREIEQMRSARARPPERLPPGELLSIWRGGCLLMGSAALLFFLSASLYHENHFPLAGLWALFGS